MMFYSDALRVVLATVHIPLAEVPRALTRESLEATIALTAAEMPRFGWPCASARARRPEPARRRARADGPRRRRRAGAGGRCQPRAWRRDRRAAPGGYGLRARDARRVRRRHRLLSRPGADPGEAGGVRPGRQRHAGAADHPDVGRPRDGVRHRRARRGRSVEPGPAVLLAVPSSRQAIAPHTEQ